MKLVQFLFRRINGLLEYDLMFMRMQDILF